MYWNFTKNFEYFQATKGKLKIEDAGFDWKILGPDVDDIDYVCY